MSAGFGRLNRPVNSCRSIGGGLSSPSCGRLWFSSSSSSVTSRAKIAVIGAGWWSQGWHLPQLHRNPNVDLVAIVDTSPHPKSNLNPNLQPLTALQEKYKTVQIFSTTHDLLEAIPDIDGAIVATPHASHFQIGQLLLQQGMQRLSSSSSSYKPLHILMEKPMTTSVSEAHALRQLVLEYQQQASAANVLPGLFKVNHSANFQLPTKLAREFVASGQLGTIRHVSGFMASPLKWIFDDPLNTGWNEPHGPMMLGNGFAWGQSSHLLSWIYHVCPTLQPHEVFCAKNYSTQTAADVSNAATVVCRDESSSTDDAVIVGISGTSLLPGNAHSDPPVGKQLRFQIFGDHGAVLYGGDDRDPTSGRLEFRKADGSIEVAYDQFVFEDLDTEGLGPESLQSFVAACNGHAHDTIYQGADVTVGLKSVQTLDAMYRSNASRKLEPIQ